MTSNNLEQSLVEYDSINLRSEITSDEFKCNLNSSEVMPNGRYMQHFRDNCSGGAEVTFSGHKVIGIFLFIFKNTPFARFTEACLLLRVHRSPH